MNSIPSQRHRFVIPQDVHYLNCAYMSPVADTVRDAIVAGAGRKVQPWTYQASEFFFYPEAFRERAATILNADTASIAIVPSVSYALAIAARNLPLAAGQSIIVLADQFPSNVYIWRERARETGAQVVIVQRDADAAWTEAVLNAIDKDTAIVAVPNCHWADGRVVDLVAVGRACRKVGAALVLDLTQSLGAMPFDVQRVQPDFAVAACYKWLMGPYGVGALYVAPKYHDGTPIEHSWANRAGAEDFTRLVDYRDDFALGARRYDMGEKSNPPLLAGASVAIDMLLDWGIGNIAATLALKTQAIAEAAAEIGISSAPLGVRASHFLALSFRTVPEGLVEALAERNVFASLRGTSLRVTPHLYNDTVDASQLIDALNAVLEPHNKRYAHP